MRNTRLGQRLGPLLAASMVLAAVILLATGGPAQAISGFASDQPAVHAQYPDAAGYPVGQKPAVTTLANVMRIDREIVRRIDRDPKLRAQARAVQKQIRRQTTAALASAPGLSPPESGSAILLLAAIAVMAAGGALRWRRGLGEL